MKKIKCNLKQILLQINYNRESESKPRLTRADLSRITGLSWPTIDKYYNNTCTSFRVDSLEKICTTLDIDLNELLGLE